MTDRTERDEAAAAALERAMHKAWPPQMMANATPGWANTVLAALRTDPEGRDAIVAALLAQGEPPLRLPGENPDVETEL